MIIRRSSRFERDYKKLPKEIQRQTDKKLKFLLADIHHPSLRAKRVKKYKRLYGLSITMQYRCLFEIEDNIYYLYRIGKHDEILK